MSTPRNRIAVLADIHGNFPALRAVVKKLETLQPDFVIVNGDLINAVPFSAEVVEFVRHAGWTVVRGNHEFYYLDYGTERAPQDVEDPSRWGGLHWLLDQLSPQQAGYLAMLPDERTLYLPGTQPVSVAHGVPGRNRVGFYHGQDVDMIVKDIQHVAESTLLSAHTHVQIDRHIVQTQAFSCELIPGNGCPDTLLAEIDCQHWHVINPGSVGLPLNSSPTAQFAMIESVPVHEEPGGWKAKHYRVPYDRRAALEAFETSGMLEAGGVIAELFYWELVTAEPEIIYFMGWARGHGLDPDNDLRAAFEAYTSTTGRRDYVRARDPLAGHGSRWQ